MKVAFYKNAFADNHGAERAVENLAAGLRERGHEVTLFTKPEISENRCGKYDVIIAAGPDAVCDLAAFSNLPPIVQQFHTDVGHLFPHRIWNRTRYQRMKSLLKKASFFRVFVQPHVAKLQEMLEDVAEWKVAVIGNWSVYEPDKGSDQPEQKIIFCPGEISKENNQDLLVNAFAAIANDFPEWRVQFCGEGDNRDTKALWRLITRLGLSDRILFDETTDIAKSYAECAFVAFPAKTTGWPSTIVDAATFSKPALMTRDWIGCGVVAAEEDFVEALRRLMVDENYRHTLGKEAKKYCCTHYSREVILSKWEKMLCKVTTVAQPRSPLVSVIVPAYNVEKTVADAVMSLVLQDYPNREILCVNDGSTDGTPDILEAFARKYPYVRVIHKRNRGYGSAINLGLAEAKGEWVAILESDDVCAPTMLSSLVKLGEESGAHVVKADWNLWWYDKQDIRPAGKMREQWCNHFLSQEERLELCRISPAIWSALYRRQFLREAGIKCLETPGAAFQDTSFNIKAILACERLVVTRDAFVNYRQDNPASSVQSQTSLFSIVKEYTELSDFLKLRSDIAQWATNDVRELEYRAYLWNLKRVDASQRSEFMDVAGKRLPNYKLFATPELLLRKIDAKLRRRERRRTRLLSLHWNANRIELIIRGKTVFYHSF